MTDVRCLGCGSEQLQKLSAPAAPVRDRTVLRLFALFGSIAGLAVVIAAVAGFPLPASVPGVGLPSLVALVVGFIHLVTYKATRAAYDERLTAWRAELPVWERLYHCQRCDVN